LLSGRIGLLGDIDSVGCIRQCGPRQDEDKRDVMSENGNEQAPAGIVIRPGGGRRIEIPGVPEITAVKAAASDTSGKASVHEEWHGADDTGVPRHFHRYEDQMC
jgi:hypothetical protein